MPVVFFFVKPFPALAFKQFLHLKRSGHTCQTSCHHPENILRAKQDKTSNPECQLCHGGSALTNPFGLFPKTRIRSQILTSKKSTRSPLEKIVVRSSKVKISEQPTSPPKMAYIPKGDFIMGSNDRWDDESPEFMAHTQAFFIDLYEVTNLDYSKFITTTKSQPPYHWPEGRVSPEKAYHPVVYVSWFDANNYCQWAGKRLPTELEWEKAARGIEGYIYPWGNTWDLNKSNNPYNYSTGTKPVGSYPAGVSPFGLFDMSGNVWEWVDSYYLPHPGNSVYKPEYGKKNRVLKGGSWFDCLSYGCGLSAPTFNRGFFTPEVKNNSFGFRCAQSAEEKVAKSHVSN